MPEIYTYWVYGNRHDAAQFMSTLAKKITSSFADTSVNWVKFDVDASDPLSVTAAQIIKVLRNRDAFDNRPRVLEMRGIPEDYALLTDFIPLTNKHNVLIINSAPGYRGSYGRWNSIQNSKLFKCVKEKGVIKEFATDAKSANDAIPWCDNIFVEFGKTADKGCSESLIAHKGLNLDILFSEIEKLCTYQSAKRVVIADVIECCSCEISETVWSFIDYLDMGDYDRCHSYLEAMYTNNTSSELYGSVSALLAALLQHLIFILFIRDGRDSGLGDAESLKGWKKLNLSDIRAISSGNIDMTTLDDYFKPNFISYNLYKKGVQNLLKLQKGKIYRLLNYLQRTILYCRVHSNNASLISMCLSVFVMAAMEKMSPETFFAICKLRRCV